MANILFSLIGGLIAGYALRSFSLAKVAGRVTLIGVMLLLFVMGMQIGSDATLFSRLPIIGLRAAALAIFCAAGSVLFSLPLRKQKR